MAPIRGGGMLQQYAGVLGLVLAVVLMRELYLTRVALTRLADSADHGSHGLGLEATGNAVVPRALPAAGQRQALPGRDVAAAPPPSKLTTARPPPAPPAQPAPAPPQKAPAPPAAAPAPPAPKVFIDPVLDPSWVLLPDAEAPPLAPLPGEGIVSPAVLALPRKGRGVIFNAIHRDPEAQRASKMLAEVARSAKRMWDAFAEEGRENDLGYAVFTERPQWEFMNDPVRCRTLWPECAEFAETKRYITRTIFYEDLDIPPILERRERFQTWPELWLKRMVATLNSPFEQSLIVDTDVYACRSFESLFDEYLGDGDVAITLAPAPFGCSRNYVGAFRPGFPARYANFTERNLGLHVLATGKPEVLRLVTLFRDAYIRQVSDLEHVSIGNDQSAFREAVFTLQDSIKETLIPSDVGCRHNAGCADGCLVVHRHHKPELSAKDYEAWKHEQNAANKIKQDERKAVEAEAELEAEAAKVVTTVPPK